MFFDVRGATRLPSGAVVVADGRSKELRWFAPDGSFVRSVGREGEGPGEAEDIGFLARAGGELFVYDAALRRMTRLDSSGIVLGSERWPGSPPGCAGLAAEAVSAGCVPVGVLADGQWIIEPVYRSTRYEVVSGGLMVVGLFDGERVTGLDSVPREDLVGGRAEAPGFPRGIPYVDRHPFRSRGVYAFGGAHIALGETGQFEIRIRGATGALNTIIRRELRQRQPTDADVSWYLSGYEDRNAMHAHVLSAVFKEGGIGEVIPSFDGIMLGTDGRIWVRSFQPAAADRTLWTVFAPDGSPLGQAETPRISRDGRDRSTKLFEIGPDYLLGMEMDEDLVERVVLYNLTGTLPG